MLLSHVRAVLGALLQDRHSLVGCSCWCKPLLLIDVRASFGALLQRVVHTKRESTQAAISDTYNGDGKVYAALRAAAYVSWEILSFVFTDADW